MLATTIGRNIQPNSAKGGVNISNKNIEPIKYETHNIKAIVHCNILICIVRADIFPDLFFYSVKIEI